jgi:hypothetical protein
MAGEITESKDLWGFYSLMRYHVRTAKSVTLRTGDDQLGRELGSLLERVEERVEEARAKVRAEKDARKAAPAKEGGNVPEPPQTAKP